MKPAIVWFRRNLRVADNDALHAAAESNQPVIPVYVSDDLDTGGASRWWLHHSLTNLETNLQDLGGDLVVRTGQPADVLADIVEETGATRIFYSCRYEPDAQTQERQLDEALASVVDIEAFDDGLLIQPRRVMTQQQTPYKVFTPYWRAATACGEPPRPRPVPDRVDIARHNVRSLQIADLELLPVNPDWSQGLVEKWRPGETGGHRRLDEIESAARHYAVERDRPDLDSTSHLSPHLHFGEVSVRQVWHSVNDLASEPRNSTGAAALLRQVYWRDFSSYLLFHFPDLPAKPLRKEFEFFPWSDDGQMLRAWQRGETGFPIVDAGMRQLWSTGWMHNRVRMIVGSFLVKDLLIPWQRGADWFMDTLVDADLANNSASWQWVAGCGTDSAPYFRIFNPVLQAKKFDPNGDYVRRWIPELRTLPTDVIHEPWLADGNVLNRQQREDLQKYPEPIIDRSVSRARALEAYRSIRSA